MSLFTGLLPPYKICFFQSPPYSMPKDAKKNLRGNEEFEGYAVDLIAEIAEILSK